MEIFMQMFFEYEISCDASVDLDYKPAGFKFCVGIRLMGKSFIILLYCVYDVSFEISFVWGFLYTFIWKTFNNKFLSKLNVFLEQCRMKLWLSSTFIYKSAYFVWPYPRKKNYIILSNLIKTEFVKEDPAMSNYHILEVTLSLWLDVTLKKVDLKDPTLTKNMTDSEIE